MSARMIQTMIVLRRLAAVRLYVRLGEVAPDETIVGIASRGAAPEALPAKAVIVVLIVDGDAGGDTHTTMLLIAQRFFRQEIVAPQPESARRLAGQQAAIFQQAFVEIGLEQGR